MKDAGEGTSAIFADAIVDVEKGDLDDGTPDVGALRVWTDGRKGEEVGDARSAPTDSAEGDGDERKRVEAKRRVMRPEMVREWRQGAVESAVNTICGGQVWVKRVSATNADLY